MTNQQKIDAARLLKFIGMVQHWLKAGDLRGKPFLDAGAVVVSGGRFAFHRERFCKLATEYFEQGKDLEP